MIPQTPTTSSALGGMGERNRRLWQRNLGVLALTWDLKETSVEIGELRV